ncbi:hypothetical protein B0H11DRAFT_1944629 [Mycena galericulata]|nr:hypothetical protein B0H11DRAFT_1944629 [Mycena galericulata]
MATGALYRAIPYSRVRRAEAVVLKGEVTCRLDVDACRLQEPSSALFHSAPDAGVLAVFGGDKATQAIAPYLQEHSGSRDRNLTQEDQLECRSTNQNRQRYSPTGNRFSAAPPACLVLLRRVNSLTCLICGGLVARTCLQQEILESLRKATLSGIWTRPALGWTHKAQSKATSHSSQSQTGQGLWVYQPSHQSRDGDIRAVADQLRQGHLAEARSLNSCIERSGEHFNFGGERWQTFQRNHAGVNWALQRGMGGGNLFCSSVISSHSHHPDGAAPGIFRKKQLLGECASEGDNGPEQGGGAFAVQPERHAVADGAAGGNEDLARDFGADTALVLTLTDGSHCTGGRGEHAVLIRVSLGPPITHHRGGMMPRPCLDFGQDFHGIRAQAPAPPPRLEKIEQ